MTDLESKRLLFHINVCHRRAVFGDLTQFFDQHKEGQKRRLTRKVDSAVDGASVL